MQKNFDEKKLKKLLMVYLDCYEKVEPAKPKEIVKKLKISRSAYFYYKAEIIKRNYYSFKMNLLTNEGKAFINKYRGHGYEVYFLLPPSCPRGQQWEKDIGAILSTNKIEFKPREPLVSKQGIIQDTPIEFNYLNILCYCFANGVYAYFPEVIADTPSDTARKEIETIISYAKQLSEIFKIDFLQDNKLYIKIRKSHLAHMHNEVAKEIRLDRKKLHIYLKNELRLIVDFSNNIDEFETITVAHGLTDMHCLQNYQQDTRRHGGNLKIHTKDLLIHGNPTKYYADILHDKDMVEENPIRQSAVYLPSEVTNHIDRLDYELTELKEIARLQMQNSSMTQQNMQKMAEENLNFAQNLVSYHREIEEHRKYMKLVNENLNTQTQVMLSLLKKIEGPRHRESSSKQTSLKKWGVDT